jgi:hypothetical protein
LKRALYTIGQLLLRGPRRLPNASFSGGTEQREVPAAAS